jgi:diguanylate cyclase (GGDEF)-like protein/PAS domain S-box-containing protein
MLVTIFENVPANFYVKDINGRYQYGSSYGYRLFGVEPEQAIGRTDAELFPPALAERFADSDRRVLEGKEMASVSFAVPVLGQSRHFAGVRFPIPGTDGKPIGVCGFAVDVTERIELANELEKLATTDALTGLANRRRFDEHFAAEVARAARSGEPLTLVLCDVDHFKRYNDRYGHLRGDTCLVEVGRALQVVVRRPADLAARYGGEEFALVLPGTSQEGATTLADRLRESVRALAIEHDANDGHSIVTLSAGVATVIGAWTTDEIFGLADRALYEAKNAGRDRHVCVLEERVPGSIGRER